MPDDTEDSLLNGSASARKFEGKARAALGPDGSLPDLSTEPSTPLIMITKPVIPKERMTSSSPSTPVHHVTSHSEPMRKGVSKFDLRDDEWMMVEDEFLETAKLFTQHLHIAEYQRLKESIEEKKKEAEVTRPIVAGAKYSTEGTMKERAKMQRTNQKKAILGISASQSGLRKEDGASHHAETNKTPLVLATPRSATSASRDTDSDDLDAQRPQKLKISEHAHINPRMPQHTLSRVSKPAAAPSFAKATLSVSKAPARPRGTLSKMMPFDMLEEYTKSKVESTSQSSSTSRKAQMSALSKQHSQSTSSTHSSFQTAHTTVTFEPENPFDLLDDWGPSRDHSNSSKEIAGGVAKRKAGREKQDDKKRERRNANPDDIPTFLF